MCKENITEYNPMELWLKLIDAETEEDLAELEKADVKEINDAITILREMSADEEIQHIAYAREKALNNEPLSINSDEEKEKIISALHKMDMTEEEIQAFLTTTFRDKSKPPVERVV